MAYDISNIQFTTPSIQLSELNETFAPLRSAIKQYTIDLLGDGYGSESVLSKVKALESSVHALASFALSSGSIVQSLLTGGDVTPCQFLKELETAYQTLRVEGVIEPEDTAAPVSDRQVLGHEQRKVLCVRIAKIHAEIRGYEALDTSSDTGVNELSLAGNSSRSHG